MEPSINCKNCEEILQGSFCHQCGQKLISERFTFKRIFSNLLANIFNIEKGFNYTIKQLFLNPGKVANDYINGKTVGYYHPFRYLFIWITISAVIMLGSGVYDAQTADIGQHLQFGPQSPEDIARQKEIAEFMRKYVNLVPLVMLPFIATVSFWLSKSKGFNLAEHLIAISYFFAQTTMIGIPFVALYYFVPSMVPYAIWIGIGTSVLFFAYAFKDWFKISTSSALLKGFLSIILGYLLMFVFSFVAGLLIALISIFIVKKIM